MAAAQSRPFLTAEWHHVLAVTYAADAALLEPHLPRGARIDELDGAPRVSLVAFGFRRTRVRGLLIAGHVTFPEINLRFYVRMSGERAVVFVREFVPRPAITLVARLLITAWRRPRTSMWHSHTFGPASLPGGASDHLDRARTYGTTTSIASWHVARC